MSARNVVVRTIGYEHIHGKRPRGTGDWVFFADRAGFGPRIGDQPHVTIHASYGEAKSAAQRWAAGRGIYEIYVGS